MNSHIIIHFTKLKQANASATALSGSAIDRKQWTTRVSKVQKWCNTASNKRWLDWRVQPTCFKHKQPFVTYPAWVLLSIYSLIEDSGPSSIVGSVAPWDKTLTKRETWPLHPAAASISRLQRLVQPSLLALRRLSKLHGKLKPQSSSNYRTFQHIVFAKVA